MEWLTRSTLVVCAQQSVGWAVSPTEGAKMLLRYQGFVASGWGRLHLRGRGSMLSAEGGEEEHVIIAAQYE